MTTQPCPVEVADSGPLGGQLGPCRTLVFEELLVHTRERTGYSALVNRLLEEWATRHRPKVFVRLRVE